MDSKKKEAPMSHQLMAAALLLMQPSDEQSVRQTYVFFHLIASMRLPTIALTSLFFFSRKRAANMYYM